MPTPLHYYTCTERESQMEKISKLCLKVKILGQTTEGKEFQRTGWNICLRSDLGRLPEAHPPGCCLQTHVQIPPEGEVFGGWSEQLSLC